MKYLFLFFLIQIALTADCTTPKDCFNQAADELDKARIDYYQSLDRVYKLANSIATAIKSKLDTDTTRMGNINNGIYNLGQSWQSIYTPYNSLVDGIYTHIHQENCRVGSTGCNDTAKGNAIYLDRHHNYCNGGEYMKEWALKRCGGDDIRIQFICCAHPQ